MPSWRPFSYFFIITDSGTLAQATLLPGVGSQIAAETRASSGASVGRQGERVRGIVLVYCIYISKSGDARYGGCGQGSGFMEMEFEMEDGNGQRR